MLQDSFQSAEADMRSRALREEQVDAERILLATQSALDADSALLNTDEQAEIGRLMDAVRAQVRGEDQAAIKVAVDALAQGTEEFAARRMDRSVHAALAGKKLAEIGN